MRTDLPLVNEALLVRMNEFDGVLDGDDVKAARFVDEIDDGRQGRRFPRTRRSGHQHQTALHLGQTPHLIGKTELVDGHDLRRNDPKDRAGPALLAEEIDAISGYAGNLVRKVDVAAPHELVPQPRRS